EWGSPSDVQQVVSEWIDPHIHPESVVGEIGTGGGRVAALVAPKVGRFHAFDISARMLDRARHTLSSRTNCEFHLLEAPRLDGFETGSFDFLYSFDVFVHLDLHTQWSYISEVSRLLKPGGQAFLHTANLASNTGWGRFAGQERYAVEGFYFVTPDLVKLLCRQAGLGVVAEMSDGAGNFYYERDYLLLVAKPTVETP
ncbi:MAG TPA: class I SAM-dependent methyltransferase, partial [Isosphaeraceae bacterium]|nr:class I SAM-dependent methyltransferase [Isosphaeraceae bacterium]